MTKDDMSRRNFLSGAAVAATSVALGAGRSNAAVAASEPVQGAVRFGVTARQAGPYPDILEFWQAAEAAGFDTAFVYDHFMPMNANPTGPCCHDGWALLSGLAAQTKRLRLGVLVTGNTYRPPAVVAKMATTIDHISGGRVIVGMGAGWMKSEHTAFGLPFYTKGERARRLVEAVEVMKMLFTQEVSNFDGKYYSLKNAPSMPKPIQKPHPPILIGGKGPKVIQPLAARHAQIWHFGLPGNDPVQMKELSDHFDGVCREVGRDPAEVEKATSLIPMELDKKPSAQIVEEIQALVKIGIRHYILVPPPSNDDIALINRYAEEVLPAFREA